MAQIKILLCFVSTTFVPICAAKIKICADFTSETKEVICFQTMMSPNNDVKRGWFVSTVFVAVCAAKITLLSLIVLKILTFIIKVKRSPRLVC